MHSLVPQLCTQCRDGEAKPVVGQWPGWGTEGNLTLHELSCGHRFLLHTDPREVVG